MNEMTGIPVAAQQEGNESVERMGGKAEGKVKKALKKWAKKALTSVPHRLAVASYDRIYLAIGSQAAGKSTLRQQIDSVVCDGNLSMIQLARACDQEPTRIPGVGNLGSPELPMDRHLIDRRHERSEYRCKGRMKRYAIESVAAEALDHQNPWLRKRFQWQRRYIPIFVINGASAGLLTSKLIFMSLVRDLQLRGASLSHAIRGVIELMWSVDLSSIERHDNHAHLRGFSEKLAELDERGVADQINAVVVDGIPGFSSTSDDKAAAIALNNDIDQIIRPFVEREQARITKMIALRNVLSRRKLKKAVVVVTRRDLVEGVSQNDPIFASGRTLTDVFDDIVHVMDPRKELIPESNKFSVGFIDWSWKPTLRLDVGELVRSGRVDEKKVTRMSDILFGLSA